MAIDEGINEYSEWSCTCGNQNMHRKWPKRVWMRTWAVIHKALSRSKVSAPSRNNFEHVIEQNKIDHVWQLNQTNNQSIIRKSHMLGPHQSPIYIARINLTNPIISELWRFIILACVKIKRNRTLFKNRGEIKTIWEKIGFLKFIWKIGVSKITWKSEFWKLNLRIGILDIKFKRNWNFEN